MKGYGYNILSDKLKRPGLSLKSAKAWLRFQAKQWPYASTRQVERYRRQIRLRNGGRL